MNENIEQILKLINTLPDDELKDALLNYHANDIAMVFEHLTNKELERLYKILPNDFLSEIFTYLEQPTDYVETMSNDKVADILEEMDSDDAVDFLDELNKSDVDTDDIKEIEDLIDDKVYDDIELINSYETDEIGSMMTNNFIAIDQAYSVKEAMKEVIKEAAIHDNINVIFTTSYQKYTGLILLRDLICARSGDKLSDIIKTNYPYLKDKQKMEDIIDELKDYDLDTLAVLNEEQAIVGAITKEDILEFTEDSMTDDYAKFVGINDNEEIEETESTFKSAIHRLPWLILLLGIGLLISIISSNFEKIIIGLTAIVFFQSMIFDMSGNSATQSLGVTILNLNAKDEKKRFFRELLIGMINGAIIAVLGFITVFVILLISKYQMHAIIKTSITVGLSLFIGISISNVLGFLVPTILNKLHIDPAYASGPFITTMNDVTSLLIYYGIASLLFYVL